MLKTFVRLFYVAIVTIPFETGRETFHFWQTRLPIHLFKITLLLLVRFFFAKTSQELRMLSSVTINCQVTINYDTVTQRLSWFRVLNYQCCNQCLKCHKLKKSWKNWRKRFILLSHFIFWCFSVGQSGFIFTGVLHLKQSLWYLLICHGKIFLTVWTTDLKKCSVSKSVWLKVLPSDTLPSDTCQKGEFSTTLL